MIWVDIGSDGFKEDANADSNSGINADGSLSVIIFLFNGLSDGFKEDANADSNSGINTDGLLSVIIFLFDGVTDGFKEGATSDDVIVDSVAGDFFNTILLSVVD